ncbi:MAG: peptidoglycan-binding domain-containing protein [Thermoguttaceae bacterium]
MPELLSREIVCRVLITLTAVFGLAGILAADDSLQDQTVKPGILPELSAGASGNDVKLLQNVLNSKLKPHPHLTVDGVFGPATTKAVKAFQRSNALAVDGIVGTKTWEALFDIKIGPHVQTRAAALAVLRMVLDHGALATTTVSSGFRSAYDQARVMHYNIKRYGVASQKALYGPAGDKVIDVYANNSSLPRDKLIALMKDKIKEIGPSKVSRHCGEKFHAIDVEPESIAERQKFEKALAWAKKKGLLSSYILPPLDPGYHLEIPANINDSGTLDGNRSHAQ